MFKYFVIMSLFLFSQLLADSIDDEEQHLKEAALSFIKNRCRLNGVDDAFDTLKYSIDDFRVCVNREIVSFTADSEQETLQKICSSVPSSLHSCLVMVLDALEPCLDKQEYYFPNFVSKWFNATFEKHCKDGGETIIEHIKGVIDLDCKAMDKQMTHTVAEKCFLQSTVITDFESPDFVITENKLCTYFKKANECLMDILKDICSPKVTKYMEYHLEPTKMWCDKHVVIEE